MGSVDCSYHLVDKLKLLENKDDHGIEQFPGRGPVLEGKLKRVFGCCYDTLFTFTFTLNT